MILIKIGEGDDNLKESVEYNVEIIGRPMFGEECWFKSNTNHNVLYHTEPLTKISKDHLKSRKCKYLLKR